MELRDGFMAIRVHTTSGKEVVHIAGREDMQYHLRYIKREKRRDGQATALCRYQFDLSQLDIDRQATGDDVNCDACIAKIEEMEKFVRAVIAYETMKAYEKGREERERQAQEDAARHNKLIRECERMNTCFAHMEEPGATLHLSDELLLNLATFGSVGEVMLPFVFDDDGAYQYLLGLIGHSGVAQLRTVLLTKGYFKPENMIW